MDQSVGPPGPFKDRVFMDFRKFAISLGSVVSVDLLTKKSCRFTRGDASWEISLSGVIRCAETESGASRHPSVIINSLVYNTCTVHVLYTTCILRYFKNVNFI